MRDKQEGVKNRSTRIHREIQSNLSRREKSQFYLTVPEDRK